MPQILNARLPQHSDSSDKGDKASSFLFWFNGTKYLKKKYLDAILMIGGR